MSIKTDFFLKLCSSAILDPLVKWNSHMDHKYSDIFIN